MNERLGRGINMGNCFEAPSEEEWGNPWKPEYFKIISELGFDHVRLPVRWEPDARSISTPPFTINPAFLNRIQQVVDTALKYDLHIIVNMHHHEALYEDPAAQKERFLSQWNQIATHFKDHSDNLLFEVLNEPHGNVTPAIWNEYFADALAEIRKTNPTRVVLMGVAEYGGLGAISQLELPDDEYIILSPHYYNPFNFTHQGAEWVGPDADAWLGTTWKDTEADRQTVESEFNFALSFSEENHIPIHVGEFGAYSKADIESRERWTTFLARWFESKNMSWAYWEFSAGFGIYNSATEELLTPLVDALVHNEMPDPTPVSATPVYISNFSNGTDGWALTNQGGAASSLSSTGGKLNVSISSAGTESWHVQLVKNNIPLTKGKTYRISFKAQAAANRSATFYAGKASDPWNAYSGYNSINIGTTESFYTFSFMMNNPTDPAARLVFDLGTNLTSVSITEIKVEEITTTITSIEEPSLPNAPLAYPNPVTSILYVDSLDSYTEATVSDMRGQSLLRFAISPGTTTVNFENVAPGLYILILRGNGRHDHLKVIKE
ncbi:MAG TPA: cellulase family glycosylhydrolase [Chryseolinea sp.]|nr:cellulase family glycosylhydrolase [Chryseolinea sp.]